jgi:hypothetical protein
MMVLAVAVPVAAAQEPVPHRHPVQLRDAWVRAQPSASGMSVLYGTLANESDREWVITRVMCERVRRPEIHETFVENDVVRMQRVNELRLAKDERVDLRPGGLHLMLMGLEAPLQPGEYVYCTFLAGDVVVARDRGVVRAP